MFEILWNRFNNSLMITESPTFLQNFTDKIRFCSIQILIFILTTKKYFLSKVPWERQSAHSSHDQRNWKFDKWCPNQFINRSVAVLLMVSSRSNKSSVANANTCGIFWGCNLHNSMKIVAYAKKGLFLYFQNYSRSFNEALWFQDFGAVDSTLNYRYQLLASLEVGTLNQTYIRQSYEIMVLCLCCSKTKVCLHILFFRGNT